jgi:hypothetical protein
MAFLVLGQSDNNINEEPERPEKSGLIRQSRLLRAISNYWYVPG